AAAAAALGAICGTAGAVMLAILGRGGPDEADGFVSFPEALGAAAAGTEPGEPSMFVGQVDHLGDRVVPLTTASVLAALGILGALLALTYLFRAARARMPEIGRAVGWSIAAALAIYPLGVLLSQVGSWIAFADFADASERTAAAAKDLRTEGVAGAGLLLETLGAFAFALSFVLVSLNAMRVGLLTRFMGILGVIVGALAIFQLDAPQVVRGVWLIFLGLLISGRYPGGNPPAWETGRAEPWPSQQQLRERREALRAEHRADEPAGEPEEEPAAKPHPQSKKKKKKRR
ncbi:MAG: hypothetical protein M3389_15005, partial [Actinomycetota bacterium]|nr:hypothetical protein [Actinomycetota bacterium]